MKKIPTLFERVYENHKVVDVLDKVTAGMVYGFYYLDNNWLEN